MPKPNLDPTAKTIAHPAEASTEAAANLPPTRALTDPAATPGESGFNVSATIDSPPSAERRESRGGSSKLPEIPGYEVQGVLGRGGMGVVYRARQLRLNRLVAIKMLLAGDHAAPEQWDRFHREAQSVARLLHPNIVQIYEVGEHQGLPFFSLEYVSGGSLAQRIASKPQTPDDAARLTDTLARAINSAHLRGIVHRDLKPANVLLSLSDQDLGERSAADVRELPLSSLTPKVNDFGLAICGDFDSRQTRSGTIMGSPSYMAPEQAVGKVFEHGPLVDIYALGAILYELLTGRPPFLAPSPLDTLKQVVSDEPVPPSQLAPNIPRDLETICLKCLQKDPARRYDTAEALADDLERFQRGLPILARPVSVLERARRWCVRNPGLAISTSLATALLVSTAVIASWSANEFRLKNIELAAKEETARKAAESEAAQRKVAIGKQNEAVEQATLALETVQTLIDQVMKQIDDAPGTWKLKQTLLETALAGPERVTQTKSSTSKKATIAAAHQKLGDLYRQLGDIEKSYAEYEFANRMVRQRVVELEGTDTSRLDLAVSCIAMSEAARLLKRDLAASEAFIRDGIRYYEDILATPKTGPGKVAPFRVRFRLADAYNGLGRHFIREGNPAPAFEAFTKSLEITKSLVQTIDDPRELTGLDEQALTTAQAERAAIRDALPSHEAVAEMALGSLSFRLGNNNEAERHFRAALALAEQIHSADPAKPASQQMLAQALGALGDYQLQTNQLEAAEPHCQRSIELIQPLAKSDEANSDYQRDLGVALYRQGNLLRRLGREEESLAAFKTCREVRQKMAELSKSNLHRELDWRLAEAYCGDLDSAAKVFAQRLEDPNTDNELLVLVARGFAICAAAKANDDAARGYRDQAFAAMERLTSANYRDWAVLRLEPDFDPLRDDPRFQAIFDKAQESKSVASK